VKARKAGDVELKFTTREQEAVMLEAFRARREMNADSREFADSEQTPCHQREGVDFKSHVGSRGSVNAHPFSLTATCESNRIKAQTAFIAKGVIGNDATNMYIFALTSLLSCTSDIEV
jgi:hypothetical protein